MSTSMFSQTLCANGPAAGRNSHTSLYGWLIGSWDLDVVEYLDDGRQRWSFREITPDSFLRRGEVSPDNGNTWHCHMEYRARRIG